MALHSAISFCIQCFFVEVCNKIVIVSLTYVSKYFIIEKIEKWIIMHFLRGKINFYNKEDVYD